ncbi:MAG: sigma-70 family RNA polymerase sigma factor [Firmicutes bacterium]|nr:sigma-70 family RNA polymerase sigma factor [Bacillota bacterium]
MKKYSELNDYELMYMVNDNDEEVLQILFEKYVPLLQKIARYYYKMFEKYGLEYDDLYQEAYIAFFKAVRYYQQDSQVLLYTYVNISVHSKLQNYIRSFTTKKNSINVSSLSLNELITGDDFNISLQDMVEDTSILKPDDVLEGNILVERLKNFCFELSFFQGQIFELKYNGFDNSEIATLLDIPSKEINNYIYRIRMKLKKYLCC